MRVRLRGAPGYSERVMSSPAQGEPLVLIGSGGFGRETAELVRAINDGETSPRWSLLGFLDDDPARWGTTQSGVRVLGGTDQLAGGLPDSRVVVCTGHPGDF